MKNEKDVTWSSSASDGVSRGCRQGAVRSDLISRLGMNGIAEGIGCRLVLSCRLTPSGGSEGVVVRPTSLRRKTLTSVESLFGRRRDVCEIRSLSVGCRVTVRSVKRAA